MNAGADRSLVLTGCLLIALAGTARGQDDFGDGPVIGGKRLSAWADEVLALNQLASVADTNHLAVQSMRAIGTNGIPWLLSELRKQYVPEKLSHQTNQEPPFTRLPLSLGSQYHQLRARAGFWALGEIAAPAIPRLVKLLEDQPEFAPSALAGIGAPALPALAEHLTNSLTNMEAHGPRAQSVASALGGLYVAIDVGRISRSEAAYFLPTVRAWAQRTNEHAGFWAAGVLKEFSFEH
jgi:hypothetical protein